MTRVKGQGSRSENTYAEPHVFQIHLVATDAMLFRVPIITVSPEELDRRHAYKKGNNEKHAQKHMAPLAKQRALPAQPSFLHVLARGHMPELRPRHRPTGYLAGHGP